MTRKLIGTAKVKNGTAVLKWDISEEVTPGNRKIYVSYVENDGYMLGEAYELAHIRSPTRITLDIKEKLLNGESHDPVNYDGEGNPIKSYGDTILLRANVENTLDVNKPVTGEVQFYARVDGGSFQPIGPVERELLTEVVGGVAEYEYTLPDTPRKDVEIKAEFIKDTNYGSCETEETGTIHIRGHVNGQFQNLNQAEPYNILNTGDTRQVTFMIYDAQTEQDIVTTDQPVIATLYLDDEIIFQRVPITSKKVTCPEYLFSQDAGEHTLRLEYPVNSDYDQHTITGTFTIRKQVEIAPTIVYAGQSYTDEETGEPVVSNAEFSVDVREFLGEEEAGAGVNTGTVTLTIGSGAGQDSITKELANGKMLNYRDGDEAIEYIHYYTIPEGLDGSDVIHYTITYNETDSYQGRTVEGIIDIKQRTYLTLTHDDTGLQGGTIMLTASILGDNGSLVNGGEVNFYLEEVEGDGENTGQGTDPQDETNNGNGDNANNTGNEDDENTMPIDGDDPVDDEI